MTAIEYSPRTTILLSGSLARKIRPSTHLCPVRSWRYQGSAEGNRCESPGLPERHRESKVYRPGVRNFPQQEERRRSELTLGGAREIGWFQ